MTKCYYCKAVLRSARVRAIRERSGQVYIVDEVPALVCGQCGEQFFEGPVLEEMDRLMEHPEGANEMRVPMLTFDGAPIAAR